MVLNLNILTLVVPKTFFFFYSTDMCMIDNSGSGHQIKLNVFLYGCVLLPHGKICIAPVTAKTEKKLSFEHDLMGMCTIMPCWLGLGASGG